MKKYELTEEERNLLSKEDKEKYDQAISYCNNWWACGPYSDGWSNGYELLKELGWKETSIKEGHRTFTSLEKPLLINTSGVLK